MLDSLIGQAETIKSLDWKTIIYTLLGSGGIGMIAVGFIKSIIKRNVNKVLDHVDNNTIHLKSGNGYVKPDDCKSSMEKFEQKIDANHSDQKQSINRVHDRIDTLILNQNNSNKQILCEIKKLQK